MNRARRRGQSLVESTLVLVAFFGMILGIVDVAQMLFSRQTLVQRVNEAARWGSMHPADTEAIRNLVIYGTAKPAPGAPDFLGVRVDAVQVSNVGCPGSDCRILIAVPQYGVRSVEPAEF